jgi:hypothetical protein
VVLAFVHAAQRRAVDLATALGVKYANDSAHAVVVLP